MTQFKFSFDTVTVQKILIHTGIIAAATALTYLVQALSGQNFGAYQVPVVAVLTWLGTVAKEWATGVPTPPQV